MNILRLISILCLYGVGVIGSDSESTEPFQAIKICSVEDIYYTATYLANKCRYVSTEPCYQTFAKCMREKGYEPDAPDTECVKELGITKKPVPPDNCDTSPSNYFTNLQMSCCSLSKLRDQMPNKSYQEFVNVDTEGCYDKKNCGQSPACSSNNTSSTSEYQSN